ncbi:signal transduction histidine kinase [Actinomadura luteofluorescens]|uniref:histidine kinase n=1 Tax=Actinomadura luteofluorescens TaxID=46163 RepID=A0A7Y9EHZ9_9ACTN|nr:sensor histidine kinase [Actinomadura luteofluorescens]NYD48043.1 signal transduction histidine kinase [Actinomadura luteofluorescens]
MTKVLRATAVRRAWTEALYLLAGTPVALVGLYYAVFSGAFGVVMSVTRLGSAATAAVLRGACRFGELHRRLAAVLLDERVPAPGRPQSRAGLRAWVRDAHGAAGYRAFLHLLVRFPLAVLGVAVVLVTWVYGFLLLTYPIQLPLHLNEITSRDPEGRVRHGLVVGGFYFDTWQRSLLVALAGAVLLAVAPRAVRLAVRLDLAVLRSLLGPRPDDARIRDLERSRSYAVENAAATLRRIERNLHDGAQVRLVSLTMTLAALQETLPDGTPEPTRELVAAARTGAREAIAELRELVRGIHPPVLDQGLDAALASVAARSPVPAELETDLPVRPSAAIESIAYFCTAELLANAGRHAAARRVTVSAVQPGDGTLRLTVTDDGRGGARTRPGGGLAGLAERVRTVDGELSVLSPPGGPTTVTVTLPLTTS